jgi:hypothetical protein
MSDDSDKAQLKIDLFYAILAMDSYNRGDGSGISGLDETGKIGNVTIREFKVEEQEGWQDAGFYAIAYKNIDTGEVVIAYRGTDANLVSPLGSVGRMDTALPWAQRRVRFSTLRPGRPNWPPRSTRR